MAQLLALGGGAGGGPFGSILGSLVVNLLFPPKPVKTEGPRLGDLAVTSSAYGAARTLGYGTIRMGGNIIWAIPIDEIKNVQKTGGKGMGGPKQENTSYTYFATFALALGQGPAEDVLRIWADGKLIFDKRGLGTNTHKEGLNFRFYPGDKVQLQDPAIVADLGIDDTPAFRDTVYLLFDGLALEDFGNRIPNIECEVTYSYLDARLVQTSNELAGGVLGLQVAANVAIDWDRDYAYYWDTSGTPAQGGIRRVNMVTLQEDREVTSAIMLNQDTTSTLLTGGGYSITPDGGLLVTLDGGNSSPIVHIDGGSLIETARFGTTGSQTTSSPTRVTRNNLFATFSAFSLGGRVDFTIAASELFKSFSVLKLPNLEYLWDSDSFLGGIPEASVKAAVGGRKGENFGEAWVTTGSEYPSPNASDLVLYKVIMTPSALYQLVNGEHTLVGGSVVLHRTFTVNDLRPGATTLKNAGTMVYDTTDNTLIMFVDDDTVKEWIKYDPDTDTIIWRTGNISQGPFVAAGSSGRNQSRLEGSTFGYIVGDNGFQLNTITGEVLFDNEAPNWSEDEIGQGRGAYDSRTESFVAMVSDSPTQRPFGRFFFNRGDSVEPTLDTIVSDLCIRAGLTSADLDVTDLASITVPGYFIARQISSRQGIEPLTNLYLIDGFESDFKLVFKKRGQAIIRTLTQDQLAIVDSRTGDVFQENREQEVELPLRFTLTYLDKDNDYAQQTHSAKRILEPLPAMRSTNELGLGLNIAMASETAKQQAEQILYSAWIERTKFSIRLDWSNIDLDPSDVILLLLADGTQVRARIGQLDIGDGFALDVVTIGEQAAQFTSTVLADGGSGVRGQIIKGSTTIKTFVLDTPLLRDQDESPGRVVNPIYFFQGSFSEKRFIKGFLFYSPDAVAFVNVGQSSNEMSWGSATGALGDPPDANPFITDNVNTLNVYMNVGGDELVSVTKLQMLNGANAGVLLKANGELELIQWQTVTLEDDGSFTLSTLLRGQRGTDTMAFSHGPGETFIVLDGVSGDLTALALDQINVPVFFKGVGAGQLFNDGEDIGFTSEHRALKPYAPVQFTAILDGSNNIDFTWVRRTRAGGGLQDLLPEVPLNEDTEAYEVDIRDGPAGTIVRTVTGLTTPVFEYLNADIISDLGSVPTVITVEVYQISAQVGRGFTREVTVDVE